MKPMRILIVCLWTLCFGMAEPVFSSTVHNMGAPALFPDGCKLRCTDGQTDDNYCFQEGWTMDDCRAAKDYAWNEPECEFIWIFDVCGN